MNKSYWFFLFISLFIFISFNLRLISDNLFFSQKLIIFLFLIILNSIVSILDHLKKKKIFKCMELIKYSIYYSIIGIIAYILFFDIIKLELINNMIKNDTIKIIFNSIFVSSIIYITNLINN